MDFKNGVATFVMPHWRNENNITKKYLDETLEKIYAQTDKNWQLVIVDDLSPSKEAVAYLDEIKKQAPILYRGSCSIRDRRSCLSL